MASYRQAVASMAEGCCCACKWSSGGTDLSRVRLTASQLDPPSLTLLSVADCGRLQLVAANWATLVPFLQVVDN